MFCLGQKAHQVTEALLNWIQEPLDSSDTLLISSISLLEALVSFYFCQEAFCKTVRIVRKTTEKNLSKSFIPNKIYFARLAYHCYKIRKTNKTNVKFTHLFDDNKLEKDQFKKWIGRLILENLSLEEHVDRVVGKMSSGVYAVK